MCHLLLLSRRPRPGTSSEIIEGMQQSLPRSTPWPDARVGAGHRAVREVPGISNIGANVFGSVIVNSVAA
uniref:Uncharacterized protein n=1 Tax=Panagrellus redivivus TaxID=6233 RepID=A0A7E4VGM4_PANRE